MRVHFIDMKHNAGLQIQQTICELYLIPTRRESDARIEHWTTLAGNVVQCDVVDLLTVTCLRCRAIYAKKRTK